MQETDKIPILKMLDIADSAIVITDSDGVVVFWNAGAEKMFGWTKQEAIGRCSTFICPDRFKEASLQGIKNRKNKPGFQSKVIGCTTALFGLRKDGTEFPCELSIINCEMHYYMAIIHDMTKTTMMSNLESVKTKLDSISNSLDKCS